MSTGKRPRGLTVLAVINFVWSGLGLIAGISLFAIPFILKQAQESGKKDARLGALEELGKEMLFFLAIVNVLSAALLICSGIGYLNLKKFLGRTLGNVYALFSIAYLVMAAAWMPKGLGGDHLHITTIIGLIFSGLTLLLLNVAFKKDFVN